MTSSPFAPTNEGSGVEDEELEVEAEGASNGHHGSKAAALGGIKGRMNLLDQVLHPDCRPVLEFSLVSGEWRGKGRILICLYQTFNESVYTAVIICPNGMGTGFPPIMGGTILWQAAMLMPL